MRKIVALLLALSLILASEGVKPCLAAEAYPNRPITLTVLSAAGGSYDLGVRLLLPYVEKILGTRINVVNNDAGNGWVNWLGCYNAKPDGYSLFTTNFPAFFSCYDPEMKHTQRWNDFAYICNFCTDTNILVVRKGYEINTVKEFLDYCLSHDNVVISVTVTGGDDHIAYLKMLDAIPELAKHTTPMHANSNSTQELLGGFIDFMICNVGNLASLGDNIEPVCAFSDKRDALAPNIPTFNEECAALGYKNVNVNGATNRGLIMPKGVPEDIQKKIVDAFVKGMNDPQCKQDFLKNRMGWNCLSGEEYIEMIKREDAFYQSTIMPLLGWK
ncbi:MAG: tripartite tricarboxylate transporter substrate binding protein [Synergistaceae bacterium]|jgi:tripartite-type tricarboxylate transporter receptor subunit TctC|nr:tripartite tricarboxylate transporter substrate binding protein [Synergistaceae bacterium]